MGKPARKTAPLSSAVGWDTRSAVVVGAPLSPIRTAGACPFSETTNRRLSMPKTLPTTKPTGSGDIRNTTDQLLGAMNQALLDCGDSNYGNNLKALAMAVIDHLYMEAFTYGQSSTMKFLSRRSMDLESYEPRA
jgi:hypothetical protein